MGSCYSYCASRSVQEPSIPFPVSSLLEIVPTSPRSHIPPSSPPNLPDSSLPPPLFSSPPLSPPSLLPPSSFFPDSSSLVLPHSSLFPSNSDPEIEILKKKMMNEHRLYQEYKSKRGGPNKKFYDNDNLNWEVLGGMRGIELDRLDILENNGKEPHIRERKENIASNFRKSSSLLQTLNFKINFPDPEENNIKLKRDSPDSFKNSKAATLPPKYLLTKGRQTIKKEDLFLNEKLSSKLDDIISASFDIIVNEEQEKIKTSTEPEEATEESPGENPRKLDKLLTNKNLDIDGREKFQRSQNSKEVPPDHIEGNDPNEESPLSKTVLSADVITKTTGNMTEKTGNMTEKTGKNYTEATSTQNFAEERKLMPKKILKTRTIGEERPKNKKCVRFTGVNFTAKKKRVIYY